ncbi:MAG TPA: type II secretion system secretin GspD [Anaeromyxobacteraceae bacterium]|nr:type II secretion system secretin GspD [Anaeromyxobacteraceae bacterium]
MRLLLAATLLAPLLAFAQAPLRPPEGGPVLPQRPAPRPLPAPGAGARPPGPTMAPPRTAPPAEAPAAAGEPRGEATTTRSDARCVPLRGRFMLTFNRADIVDVLEQASRWTCRNFIYTEDVARGKITLLSKTPVNADEAYAAFLAALNSNNIAVYPSGRYYKLIRTADAKKNPIPTYTGDDAGTPASEQPVTKVIRLQNVDADQLRGVMGNFLSPQGADIQAVPPDTLVITDIGLNVRRIERLIDAIDRGGRGDEIRVVQVRFAPVKDVADKLNQIFQAAPGAAGRGGAKRTVIAPAAQPAQPVRPGATAARTEAVEVSVTRIIPDERTNKLIIVADSKSFERILDLLQQLDVPTSAEGGIHVVFLKNANAEDLAQTLSNLAQGQARRQQATVPQPAGPGAPPAAARPTGPASAELLSGEVKVTADKAQNALIVQASGADFVAIQRLVEKLDRPRRQVFIESVIMEVNLRNETQFGVGMHGIASFDRNGDTVNVPIVSAPGRVNTFGPLANIESVLGLGGLLTGLAGPVSAELSELGIELPSLGILVQALQTSSDVNILSTPHLLASDNEESEITVGQNVPFQAGYAPAGLSSLLSQGGTGTGSALGTQLGLGGLSSLYAPIQRQNVELRLKIKPQVSEGENVRLTIEEQTEEIVERDAQLGPTTAKRTVKTQVVAKDQSTIVIGGLIQEREVNSVRKVPFLGSLPIVGWLFRDTIRSKQRTNLLLFLTPYIIREEGDYRRIYERKRKEQDEFMRQFYGRLPEYEVQVDLDRKTGPYGRIRRGVQQEEQRIEHGGPGLPGERVVVPPSERLPAGVPAAAEVAPPEPGGSPEAEGPEASPVEAPEGAEPPAPPASAPPPPAGQPATPPPTPPPGPPPGTPSTE